MKKKSILVGTVALSMIGGSLTACNNVDKTKDADSDSHEAESHDEGKCGHMEDGDGTNKEVEMKCGEDGDSAAMHEEMLCGEGKCGEGKCGGSK